MGFCGACRGFCLWSLFLLMFAGQLEASTVEITGTSFGKDGVAKFTGYGTTVDRNNVINYGPSLLTDPLKGTQWRVQGATQSSAALANTPFYEVDWYFIGAESGFANSLFFNGSLLFTEANQNNRLEPHNDPGPAFVGTTKGSGAGIAIPFSLADVVNGTNAKPGAFVASLMFAHVEPVYSKKNVLQRWRVTGDQTEWFAFALDDKGSANDDFDDFIGIAHVRAVAGPPVAPTPIPGGLPLMGSALGVSYAWARWRRRRGGASKGL